MYWDNHQLRNFRPYIAVFSDATMAERIDVEKGPPTVPQGPL
jgi:hypothetical protein